MVDATFQALVQDENGWFLTDPGLSVLERKLAEAVAGGTFGACAFEMRGLMGFLAEKGRASRALEQMRGLSLRFSEEVKALGAKQQAGRRERGERASAILGARTDKRARSHDAPKEGLSLSEIAPHEMFRDPRTFGPPRRLKK